MKVGCLTCRYVAFVAPADWKPRYGWESYEATDESKRVRETGFHQKAQCALNPEWIPVTTDHYCGRWKVGAGSYVDGNLRDFIHGSWQTNEIERLKKQVETLRAQLEKSRQISASRLLRLKKPNGADLHDP